MTFFPVVAAAVFVLAVCFYMFSGLQAAKGENIPAAETETAVAETNDGLPPVEDFAFKTELFESHQCYGSFDIGITLMTLVVYGCILRLIVNFYRMLSLREWGRWKNMSSNTVELAVVFVCIEVIGVAKHRFCPQSAYVFSPLVDYAAMILFLLYCFSMFFWWVRLNNRDAGMEKDLPEPLNVWVYVLVIFAVMIGFMILSHLF